MTNDQRIADCRRLYDKYNGRQHEQIEREMRSLGHTRFRRRILYTRRERGRTVAGWIERLGWGGRMRNAECGMRNKLPTASRIRRGFLIPKQNRQKQRRVIRQARRIARKHRREVAKTPIPTIPHSALRIPHSKGVSPFHDWLTSVSSYMTWDAAHHKHIIETLERVTTGECKRLMIFMPPRHGKSELVTVRYAAWRLRQNPAMNVILGSYNQRLANRFSRKIKTVLCEDFAMRNAECGMRNEETATERTGEASDRKASGTTICRDPMMGTTTPHSAFRSPHSDFPFARPRLKNSEAEWETRLGGGLRAVGVGSGVTGFGANLIIVDDPVKSRAEAESIKYRERVWDWFNDDLYTRLEPDGQIILIQTRWHEDDLAGRLLAEENGGEWTVINLPALAEINTAEINTAALPQCCAEELCPSGSHDKTLEAMPPAGRGVAAEELKTADGKAEPFRTALGQSPAGMEQSPSRDPVDQIGRKVGDALWPVRFNTEHLENTKEKIGNYSFASLYQQHPVPAEGGLFKRDWFRHIVDRAPRGLIWKRGYDLGITANPTSDYTASYRVAYDKNGNLYIDGGFRKRIDYPDQRRYVLGRIREELDTEHGIEDTANGSAVVQELRKDIRLQGRAFRAVKPKGDKVNRSLAWMNLAEAGNVRLIRGAWNKEFIDECCAFPLGTHDDQIDAVSIAVAMHAKHRYGFYRF